MARQMMVLRFLLPDLAAVSRRSQRVVAGATWLMFTLLAVNIAHTQYGLGGVGFDKLLNAWGQNVVLACACWIVAVRVRTGGAPGCKPLLAAIAVWTVGNLWWGIVLYDMVEAPFPSPAPTSASACEFTPAPATCRAAPGSTAWSGSCRSAHWASASWSPRSSRVRRAAGRRC